MFWNKLYKEFYPIVSEEDKMNFIHENFVEILNFARRRERLSLVNLFGIERKYNQQLKKEVSVFGNIKYGNILHNRNVLNSMINERRYIKSTEVLNETASFLGKIMVGKPEEISIDEINFLLIAMKRETQYNSIHFLLSIVGVIILFFLIMNF